MSSAEQRVICERCRTEIGADALFCPSCGTARAKRDGDPMVGEVVADRYLLRERLGHGGSGTIYLAEHVTLRRKVAVKVLHHELSRDDLAVERFRREAVTVGEIDNEHIVEVHDFGRARDGRLFLAMELLDGQTLADVIAHKRRLPVEQVVDILIQTGEALMEAHAMGYVHRDLRPRNIYLARKKGREGFVKLLDFGLAKLVEAEGEAASTSLGMTFGDPRYMSPEQARGDGIDRRADIYSLGVIAYEMLTGQPPFTGKKVFDVLTQHLETSAAPLSSHRKDVPGWLDATVTRMMSKRADDRFATVYRLVEALREGLKTGAIMSDAAAQSMPSITPPPPAPRRRETGVVRVMSRDAIEQAVREPDSDSSGSLPAAGAGEGGPSAGASDAAAPAAPASSSSASSASASSASSASSSSKQALKQASKRSSPGMSGAWFASEAAEGDADTDGDAPPKRTRQSRPSATERVVGGAPSGSARWGGGEGAEPLEDEPTYAPEKKRWLPWAIGVGALLVVGLIVILAWPGGDKPGPTNPENVAAVLPVDAAPAAPLPVAVVDAAPSATTAGATSKPETPPKTTNTNTPPVRRTGTGSPDDDGDDPDVNPFEAIRLANLPDAGPAKDDPKVTDEQKARAEFFVKLGVGSPGTELEFAL